MHDAIPAGHKGKGEPLQDPSSSSTGGPGVNSRASSLKGVRKGMHGAIPAEHKGKGGQLQEPPSSATGNTPGGPDEGKVNNRWRRRDKTSNNDEKNYRW